MKPLGEMLRWALRASDAEKIARAYEQASRCALQEGDLDRSAFFLTHAWVYALEAGDENAARYEAELFRLGRN